MVFSVRLKAIQRLCRQRSDLHPPQLPISIAVATAEGEEGVKKTHAASNSELSQNWTKLLRIARGFDLLHTSSLCR